MPLPFPAPPHIYTAAAIDRAAERRRDTAWLEQHLRHPASRLVALSGLRVRVLEPDAERPQAVMLRPPATLDLADVAFLGLDREGRAVFAAEFPEDADLPGTFVELRSVGTRLPSAEAGLLAYARGLSFWDERHRFCGRCGSPTGREQGGHVRRCSNCGLDHFPRTDPAIIVLVSRHDVALLGRSHRIPAGMYSTLAGFVEPGESLEDAVRREVFEEAGLELFAIDYRSSQPWPFPASLMLGFRARAETERIVLDRTEMEDARWFTRAEIRGGVIRLPGADSIARTLLESWLAED